MLPLPAVLATAALVGSLATASMAEQATCTYDDPSKTVTLTPPSGPLVFVQLSAEGGVISYHEANFETGEFGPAQPCGAATTSNTDLIRTQGGAGSAVLLSVDQTLGAFEPGFTAEPTGTSEIEFDFQPLGGVFVGGTNTPTVVRLGTAGANINGDDDADLTFPAAAFFGFVGGSGADDIAATGGFGTGDPATISLTVSGGEGDDLLVAGKGSVELHGFGGNDIVVGGPKADELDGDAGNDRLSGGAGADTLRGLAGNDLLKGGPKNDSLNGGGGRDRCVGGPGEDKTKKCET